METEETLVSIDLTFTVYVWSQRKKKKKYDADINGGLKIVVLFSEV